MKKYYLLAYEKFYKSRKRVSNDMEKLPLEYTLKAMEIKNWVSSVHEFDDSFNEDEIKLKLLEMHGSKIPFSDFDCVIREA